MDWLIPSAQEKPAEVVLWDIDFSHFSTPKHYHDQRGSIQDENGLKHWASASQGANEMQHLLRLSGHSGAGKSRLIRALSSQGINCPRVVIYTSRLPREGEAHGVDYYFLSRAAIGALPKKEFLISPVRTMLQAVDLEQLQLDLERNDLVLIEIFHAIWPLLRDELVVKRGLQLRTTSVFMTAVDPDALRDLPDDESRKNRIRFEVEKILDWRGRDAVADIRRRAESAIEEILEAIRPSSQHLYDYVLHSSPEGPEGEDEWTRAGVQVGRAKLVIEKLVEIVNGAAEHASYE